MSVSKDDTRPSKGARLKALIESPQILVSMAVFDGFSSRLAESAGFESLLISGSALSESRLGKPDVGIMGLEDNLAGIRAVASCVDVPLIADGDTGYGNAINVFHTVQAFERTGVAGIQIEDQVWPKRCGHMAGKELIPAEEMVQKVRAAVDARCDPDFVILARTDAIGPMGIDEAIRRANLYVEAGADLLLADALGSAADIEAFVKGTHNPVMVNMGFGLQERGTTPLLSARELQEMGVAVMVLPRMLTAAAIRGMMNAIAAFQESLSTGKTVKRPDLLVSFEELNELMGFGEIREMERRYLTDEQLASKYG